MTMAGFDDKTDSHIVLKRKEPQKIDSLVALCLRSLRLDEGLDVLRIYEAWDKVSGAAEYTAEKYFSRGTLYCRVTSSVVRSMLGLRRDELLKNLNEALRGDTDILTAGRRKPEVRHLVLR